MVHNPTKFIRKIGDDIIRISDTTRVTTVLGKRNISLHFSKDVSGCRNANKTGITSGAKQNYHSPIHYRTVCWERLRRKKCSHEARYPI